LRVCESSQVKGNGEPDGLVAQSARHSIPSIPVKKAFKTGMKGMQGIFL